MYQEIIVPIDIGRLDAARRAIDVARTNLAPGGVLTLLNVIEPLPPFIAAQLDSSVADNAVSAAESALKELVVAEQLPRETRIRVSMGSIYRKILDQITDPNKQAIVMTSHNPTFSDVLLGSVAAQTVRHAQCSVFVVRFTG